MEHLNMKNLGYLVWEKIPHECLDDADLDRLLEEGRFDLEDRYHRLIIKVKGQMLSSIGELLARSITSIRTGLSWAEWETPGGRAFIKWHIRECHRAGLDILPNFTYTPPHLGLKPATNSPPRDPLDFARGVDSACRSAIGPLFDTIELWNEPNLDTDWLSDLDPNFDQFSHMIALGALVARHHGKKVVLGGIAGVREQSMRVIDTLVGHGLMRYLDVIGFHSLRGTWSDQSPPPSLGEQMRTLQEAVRAKPNAQSERVLEEKISASAERSSGELRDVIIGQLDAVRKASAPERFPVWLTEYGFPAIDPEEKYDQRFLENIQAVLFADAAKQLSDGRLERMYWYTLRDRVSPSVRAQTTGFEDHLQYYYGDTEENGRQKLLGRLLYEGGPENVVSYVAEKNLWHLVDEASLKRHRPFGYSSQDRK